MTYSEAVSLLTSQEKFHIKLGLERVSTLLEYFGNPQDKVKCIHVAGTNGKGSTCAMLASVLAEAGYKTGLYTSPHLVEYTERMKINGEDISRQEFSRLIVEVINFSNKANIPATEFEILTVAAFIYFYEKNVDFAVIETGLGGRLDATNTIKKPLMSIITDIDLDHTARLGGSIEEIAREKAGIIKPNAPVITLKNNKGLDIIKKVSCEVNSAGWGSYPTSNNAFSNVILADPDKTRFNSGLQGIWQKRNLSLAQEAVSLLRENGVNIPDIAQENGFKNTKWQARFQYIEEENLIIDAAHNPLAAEALKNSLDEYFPDSKRIFIYSSLNTKDYKRVIDRLFRQEDTVILTKNSSPACVPPEIIKDHISGKTYTTQSVEEAVELSKKLCMEGDLLVFTGSIYTIGEFLYLNKNDFQIN